MKIEYLETVLKVADCGSFKRAAQQIPCSQSAVSKQIKSVEQELGAALFERSTNTSAVELTEACVKALPLIRQMVEYNRMLHLVVMPKPKNKEKKQLCISLDGNLMGSAAMSRLVSELYEKYPEVQLSITRCEYSRGADLLRKVKVDAILMLRYRWNKRQDHEMMQILDEFEMIPIGSQDLYIMLGEHNHHIKGDEAIFKDLRKLTFLFGVTIDELQEELDKKKGPIYGSFLKACREYGFIPQIRKVDVPPVDTNLADVKEHMVAKGNVAAILPVPMKVRSEHGVRYVHITDAPYCLDFYLVKRTGARIQGLDEFAEFMKTLF